jgi:hypothetical protein
MHAFRFPQVNEFSREYGAEKQAGCPAGRQSPNAGDFNIGAGFYQDRKSMTNWFLTL